MNVEEAITIARQDAANASDAYEAAAQAARAWRSALCLSGIAATAERACAVASQASDAFAASCLAYVNASSAFILAA